MTLENAPDEVTLSQWDWLPNSKPSKLAAPVTAGLQLILAVLSMTLQWGRSSIRTRSLRRRVERLRTGHTEQITLRTARHGTVDIRVNRYGISRTSKTAEPFPTWSQIQVEGPIRKGGLTAGMPRTIGDVAAVVVFGAEPPVETIIDVEDAALLCVMTGWQGRPMDWNTFSE